MYFKDTIYFCDGKAELSAACTPVFIAAWSFRNNSNMLICCSTSISYKFWIFFLFFFFVNFFKGFSMNKVQKILFIWNQNLL